MLQSRFTGEKEQQRVRRVWTRIIILVGLSCALFVCAVLAVVPAVNPGFGAEMADYLRAIFGPQPVAILESVSFKLQDGLNQVRSKLNGGHAQIAILQPSAQYQPSASNNSPTSKVTSVQPVSGVSAIRSAPAPTISVVTDAPQIGWQAYGPNVNGVPVMAQTMVMLDPQRTYTGIVLVRIDLSKLQLHMMPGTLEPPHSSQVAQAIPNLGMIPPADQSHLIAAFNGGFKAIHGHFGMMVDGITLLPPIPGMATIAIYRDGHIQIGAWGTDIIPSPDILAFRQNCPPLIDAGQINPALSTDNRGRMWGYTGNTDITWRTGLGITQDGRYLIYAVGNGTSAQTLADALLQAGAYNAMQLDVNQFYARFYTYQPSDPGTSNGFSLIGQRLLAKMFNDPHLYLTPYPRDFFYLTTQ